MDLEAPLCAPAFKINWLAASQHATHCHPRRCTKHGLGPVMVETPPRAGPYPPHGPARFSSPAVTLRVEACEARELIVKTRRAGPVSRLS